MTADNQKMPVRDRRTYNVPTIWNAGDTIKWDVSVPDYPASEGWVLTYEVKSTNAHLATITASADGEDYTVAITATVSAAYTLGKYHYAAYVTKSGERFTVDTGQVEILKDFEDSGNFDDRSHAQVVLDAIESVLAARATKDQESYTIAGRSLSRTSIEDLLMLRDRYKTEVIQAQRADRIARGLSSSARIRTRFI